jgi:hypothetical protein
MGNSHINRVLFSRNLRYPFILAASPRPGAGSKRYDAWYAFGGEPAGFDKKGGDW